ncbi:MAG: RNA polymerase factor sigma-54 [Deltaproteobacteria bacterium]|nr:RNA polymerase factor sigma-54 [Deltaproteobacteria bacterium]MCB9788333.1 RNA polymerase factor sigma-54 [Deltaproteobacteria bacterium]
MELKQYLKMSQQLVMTPQLQQAIRLLQLSRPELFETIQKELVENPVLEDAGLDGERTDRTREERRAEAQADGVSERVAEPERAAPESGDVVDPANRDWESFVENYNQYSYSPGSSGVRYGDDDLPTLEQTVAGHSSLDDHLTWQLGLTQLTDSEHRVAERIIGNIDGIGRFNGELLAEIAEEEGLELDEAEAVLEVIQEFDPIGVGARDLRECLLIQARHYYPDEDLVHAILDHHLEHIEKRNVAPILKDLGIDTDDLRDAMELIGTLEPKPGRNFAEETTHYITPDVYVVKVGDEYIVQLNEDGMPKLRISNFYESQIKGGNADTKTRDFIQEKFRSAVWLIRSIHQRQGTIRKVTESIVRFQREFLDRGVEYLRPLILRDVADDIGMHESTISRVTTNKYVHTPQGIFELKYFFNSRITTTSGPDVASESVKQRIKKLIGQEEPGHPLSDQALCEMLAEEGMEIARRTVAKYREMLNIPPSSKRKKLY